LVMAASPSVMTTVAPTAAFAAGGATTEATAVPSWRSTAAPVVANANCQLLPADADVPDGGAAGAAAAGAAAAAAAGAVAGVATGATAGVAASVAANTVGAAVTVPPPTPATEDSAKAAMLFTAAAANGARLPLRCSDPSCWIALAALRFSDFNSGPEAARKLPD